MQTTRLLLPAAILAAGGLTAGVAGAHAGHPELLRMMQQYEATRAALADDDVSGALTAGKRLAAASNEAHGKVAARMKPYVLGIAKAAEALAKTDADAAKVRLAFGEVSRRVLTYLDADGGVAQGRFAFECSMAGGYGKWVQTTEQVSNPYMGKKMLGCGAPTKMEP